MLDQIIPRLKEEIAIDGATGTPIKVVWEYVERILGDILQQSSIEQKTPVVDDRYKAFLWEHLKRTEELEFYENTGQTNTTFETQSINTAETTEPSPTTASTTPNSRDIYSITMEVATPEDKELESSNNQASKRKGKAPLAKRKASANKKPASKKKKQPPKKKKNVAQGDSDDDFCPGSEEEDSDFDPNESAEEDEADTNFSDDEVEDDDDDNKVNKKKSTKPSAGAHPTNVVPLKGSSAKQSDFRPIRKITFYDYEQMKAQFGERVQLKASPQLQKEQLLYGIPPGTTITSNLIVILQEIIKTRGKGLYQASISKLLDIDPRSTGHYCKSLEAKGAIARVPVAINGMRTNVCIHTRFQENKGKLNIKGNGGDEEEDLPFNVNSEGKAFTVDILLEKLVLLTKDAPDRAILSTDLMGACGFNFASKNVRKWFNRVIENFELKGYIRKTNVKLPGVARLSRCLQLIKLPKSAEKQPSESNIFDINYPMKIKSTVTGDSDLKPQRLLFDKPLEDQVFQVIEASGEVGTVQKDIALVLNIHEPRILYKLLERMYYEVPTKYSVGRVIEFEGRIKRFRYFSYPNYKKVVLGQQDDEPLPVLPAHAFIDEASCCEHNVFKDAPHNYKKYWNYLAEVKNDPQYNRTLTKILGHSKVPKALTNNSVPKTATKPSARAKKATAKPASSRAVPEQPSDTHSIVLEGSPAHNLLPEGSINNKATVNEDIDAQQAIENNDASISAGKSTTKVAPLFNTRRKTTAAQRAGNKATRQQQPSTQFISRLTPEVIQNTPESAIAIDDNAQVSSSRPFTLATSAGADESTSTHKRVLNESTSSVQTAVPSKRLRSSTASLSVAPSAAIAQSKLNDNSLATFLPREVQHVSKNNSAETSASQVTPKPTMTASGTLKRQREPTSHSTTTDSTNVSLSQVQPDILDGNTASVVTNVSSVPTSPSLRPTKKAKPIKKATKLAKGKNKISYYFGNTRARTEDTPEDDEVVSTPGSDIDVTRESTPILLSSQASQASQASKVIDESAEEDAINSAQSIGQAVTAVEPIVEVRETETTVVVPSDTIDMDKATADEGPNEECIKSSSSTAITVRGTTATATASTNSNFSSATVNENGIKTFKKEVSKSMNIYLEKRIEVFVAILQEQPIVEIGKNFRSLYQAKAEEILPENMRTKHVVDLKTLKRTADEVVKRNIGKITEVEYGLISGRKAKKTLLVRDDIDLESPEYTNFVKYIQELKAFDDTGYVMRRFEKVEFRVEPLEERLERMKVNVKQLQDSGEINKAKELEEQLDQFKKNLTTFKADGGLSISSSWMIQAVQYGWINATLLRVKRMHQHILHLFRNHFPGTDHEERTISIKTIVNYMTVETLCAIVGVFRPDAKLKAFLQDADNLSIPVKDLDKDIKLLLLSEQNKFRRRLRNIINFLLYLQVLTPMATDLYDPSRKLENISVKYIKMADKYKLNDPVPLIDKKRKGKPILNEHHIKDEADLARYYKELEYLWKGASDELLSEEEREPPPTDPMEQIMLRTLQNSKNWSARSVFSREQRQILNSYLDRIRLTTPLSSPPLMRRIAADADLSYTEVEAYYMKVEVAFDRKKNAKQVRKLAQSLIPRQTRRNKVNHPKRVISLNSTRAFLVNQNKYPKIDKDKLPSIDQQAKNKISRDLNELNEKRTRGEFMYYDDMTSLPVINDIESAKLSRRRKRRTTWTSQENELLIYAYIILRHRARTAYRFLWGPINNLFPDKPVSACRNHFQKLMTFSYYAEILETYSRMWPVLYRNGLRSGELVDKDPHDLLKIDLLEQVGFFIQKLSEHDPTDSTHISLPNNLEAFESNFDIIRASTKANKASHDTFHMNPTLVGKQRILYVEATSLNKYRDATYDISEVAAMKENGHTYRLSKMCRSIILMSLMTPEEVFDPFHCFTLLKYFPEKLFEATLKQMNEEGTLVKKGQSRRRIPTTLMSLSETFIKNLITVFPQEFLFEAKDYTQYLHRHGGRTRFTPEYVSSGMMASLLSSFSNRQLDVFLADKEAKMDEVKKMVLKSRLIDTKSYMFKIDMETIKNQDQPMRYIPSTPNRNLKNLTKEEWEAAFAAFVSEEEDGYIADLCEKLAVALNDAREQGLTGRQLYIHMLNDSSSHGLHTEEDVLTALHMLTNNNPSLVCQVGFDSIRYVHALFIHEWALLTKKLPHKEHEQAVREQVVAAGAMNISDINPAIRKEIIVPSLWTDINGNTTEVVLKDCKELFIDLVLRKPGITEADIHRHFESAFSRREVSELLGMLVEEQLLRQVFIAQRTVSVGAGRKPSIFDKNRTTVTKKKALITDTTQTCYWTVPDLFSNLA